MRIAILANVHANEPALRAVLAACAELDVERTWCIGSLLSYGPDPAAVCDLLRHGPDGDRCLLSEQDRALLTGEFDRYNRPAATACRWTLDRLRPTWPARRATRERWTWLNTRSEMADAGDGIGLHSATPAHPGGAFLPVHLPGGLDPHFAQVGRGAFVGSLNQPGIAFPGEHWLPLHGGSQSIALRGRRFIACPGSVGQPRDRDQRAAFAVLDDEHLTWYRVDYDVAETMRRMAANGQPEAHRLRLEIGV